MGRTACTELQFLYNGALYLYLLYPADWVKRLLGKVSEYLKFQENKIFKERVKNYATFLNNHRKCYCLVCY